MATRRGPRFSATREPGNDQKIRQSIGIGCQAAAGAGLVRGTRGEGTGNAIAQALFLSHSAECRAGPVWKILSRVYRQITFR